MKKTGKSRSTGKTRSASRRVAQEICLYTSEELQSIVNNMARDALAWLPAPRDTVIVGIVRRGVPLAEMLAKRLAPLLGLRKVPRLDLTVKRYADDLTLLHPETQLVEEHGAAWHLYGKTVLLVDDILYQGHSLQCALNFLVRKGAACVRTAVLVDRCMAVLPVRADITGMRLAVAPADIVECHVPPYEPHFQIMLVHRSP
jgi:pyrimidine operon attenuation protein/uracil phosphoribosyltransferase